MEVKQLKKEEIINKIITFLNSNKIGECNIEKKPNGTINFKILETFQIQSGKKWVCEY